MHILITDSGVGGLSVCAYAERFVRMHALDDEVRLTFANAAPANDYGYNAMPSREAKIETFDRFLNNVSARFAPDLIYVACNTLSVLLPDTPFVRDARLPIKGIVETAVELVDESLQHDPNSVAMIFGTQTTIDAGAYPRLLQERGIAPARIISQACPGLADTISEDREGARTREEIERWVDEATTKLPRRGVPVVAALACTHYGYRKDLFARALSVTQPTATVINPNESAAVDLFADMPGHEKETEGRAPNVRFVTRYAIPRATIDALTFFLDPISPRTVDAIEHFIHVPDLF